MIRAGIPIAHQVVIDDVGWWTAADTSAEGGPYRSGLPRDHEPADYQAIIDLGRRLHMRPQAAFVLCDWDRDHLLADLPTATWMGRQWRNPHHNDPRLEAAADLIRSQADHIEVTLHALGHEYWIEGVPSRAEWHDRAGHMRPADDLRRHLDAFGRILDRNRLGPFPRSFVPTAFLHRFGSPGGGLATLLAEYGVRYLSTPWKTLFFDRPAEAPDFGFDAGILCVDRGRDLCRWFEAEPSLTDRPPPTPIIGMHWPNLLARDPHRNGEVIDRWVALLQPLDTRFESILGAHTAAAFSQQVFHRWMRVTLSGSTLRLDWRPPAATPIPPGLLNTFVLKIQTPTPPRLRADTLRIRAAREEIPGQWRIDLEIPGHGANTPPPGETSFALQISE